MSETQNRIINRIKSIRKSKRRSIHDCARILGITKETYHNIEKGSAPISLPELELLAIYLGESLTEILTDEMQSPSKAVFLNEEIRPQFIKIREKMLRALIALARENRTATLSDIQQATHISLDTLEAYDQGALSIPIEDLLKIGMFLEIPLESLLEPLWPSEITSHEELPKEAWTPEYQTDPLMKMPELDDPYSDILKAFQMVPKQDQAYIAKYLLEKLRSM